MSPRLAGFALFTAAAFLAVGYALYPREGGDPLVDLLTGGRPQQVRVSGFVGGEKLSFLGDTEVTQILKERYGITLDVRRAGSLEMVQDPALTGQDPDFYWPSSQVALEIARGRGIAFVEDEIVFNSPIVLYSWSPIAEALVRHGTARPLGSDDAAYAVDAAALIAMVDGGVSWADIGLDGLFGRVILFSTDPERSNSGNQFAALMATVVAQGASAGAAFDDAVRRVDAIYERMGYLERSSFDLFEQYLRTGMGAKPIIAGYENQLIEFAGADPALWSRLEGQPVRPVILYPEPTVHSSHVFMAMNDAGRALLAALRDPELQEIAWTRHGFRSGFASENDPAALPVAGIPSTIDRIVPMPPFAAVERLLVAIATPGS